jgi:Helix-turn-helix
MAETDAEPKTDDTNRTVLVVTLGRQQLVLFDPAFWEEHGPHLGVGAAPVPQRRVPLAEARVLARGNLRALVQRARAAEAARLEALRKGGNHGQAEWTPPLTGPGLQARREAAALTQSELGAAASVPRSLISAVERGHRRASPTTWRLLLGALARAEAGPGAPAPVAVPPAPEPPAGWRDWRGWHPPPPPVRPKSGEGKPPPASQPRGGWTPPGA